MSVHAVADYILSKVNGEAGDTISNLKIQKLIYYCQGWHLAAFGMPLFNEPLEAWKFGPVSPPIYRRFEQFGWASILSDGTRTDPQVDLSEESRRLIDQVWEMYGREFAETLRDRTHNEPPWKLARGNIPAGAPSTARLDLHIMREFFLAEQQRLLDESDMGPIRDSSVEWAAALSKPECANSL